MVELPRHSDVYSVVERNYDLVHLSFHEAYDSTTEFASQLRHFVNGLPRGSEVLVVGGSVSECAYFRRHGIEVTNLDISKRMASHVGTGASVTSIHGNILAFKGGPFAGVWACRSLIHLHPDDLVAGLQVDHKAMCSDRDAEAAIYLEAHH